MQKSEAASPQQPPAAGEGTPVPAAGVGAPAPASGLASPSAAAAPAQGPAQLSEVRILDATAWREYRGQPGTDTFNSTHIAMIADESKVERLCFVKLAANPGRPTLLCEAMGWVLAGHAGLKRAEFAAVVFVDKARLAKSQVLSPECEAYPGDSIPAWCSQAIPGKSVLSSAKTIYKPGMLFFQELKAFLNSADARKFAAFDRWTGLRDRNMGNVIRHASGGYASIDHETLLHDLLWGSSDFLFHCLVTKAEKDLDSKRIKAFKADMTRAALGHPKALADAQRELNEILRVFLPATAAGLHAAVLDFLDQRSQRGWLAGELGVLDMAAKEDKP